MSKPSPCVVACPTAPDPRSWSGTNRRRASGQDAGPDLGERLLQGQGGQLCGSARNFRRLVPRAKTERRRGHHRGRRPAVWTPGEMSIIDWALRTDQGPSETPPSFAEKTTTNLLRSGNTP